jgi:hypothetical protein
MVIAADYPFLSVVGTMLVFFAWVIWFWMLIMVIGDIFRRRDLSGWGKTGWLVLTILLPFVGVFAYLIVNSEGMAQRSAEREQAQRAQVDDYVRSVARDDTTGDGAASEIARAKDLLDRGTIDQREFDTIKARLV